jgi:hypothetical protein
MNVDLLFDGTRRVPVRLGEKPYDAVLDTVRTCKALKLDPIRLDACEWVNLAHIAARLGVSRENVRLWAIGKYGPGRFPPPLNPGMDTKFYSWFEVDEWLREHKGYGDAQPEEPTLAAMNLALQLRRMAPRISRLDAIVDLIIL